MAPQRRPSREHYIIEGLGLPMLEVSKESSTTPTCFCEHSKSKGVIRLYIL